jgi:hypothetical protein
MSFEKPGDITLRKYLFPALKGHLEVPAVPAKGRGGSKLDALGVKPGRGARRRTVRPTKNNFPGSSWHLRFPRFPQSVFGSLICSISNASLSLDRPWAGVRTSVLVVVNGREEFVFGEHVFDSSALYREAVLRLLIWREVLHYN